MRVARRQEQPARAVTVGQFAQLLVLKHLPGRRCTALRRILCAENSSVTGALAATGLALAGRRV